MSPERTDATDVDGGLSQSAIVDTHLFSLIFKGRESRAGVHFWRAMPLNTEHYSKSVVWNDTVEWLPTNVSVSTPTDLVLA